MLQRRPKKVWVLIGLMAFATVASLVSGGWCFAVFEGLLMAGLLTANDGVRKLMVGLFALSAITLSGFSGGVLFFAVSLRQGSEGRPTLEPREILFMAILAFVLANALFGVWCLTREDVKAWMFRSKLERFEAKANEPTSF